jgi:hypothetical protein|tara:strand:- start:27 stop:680 length:654 start_codon:yes stop_codon:yes gene_type:complete
MLYAEILLREVVQWQVENAQAKLIMLLIADHTDLYGIAYPTIPRLCKLSGLSRSSVIRAVNYCVKHNYLTKVAGRTGLATVYQFNCLKEEGVSVTHQDNNNVTKLNNNTTWGVNETPTFDDFWNTYPRKIAKGHARLAFERALKKTDAVTILTAASKFAENVEHKEKQYIPHPTTWLNGERWDDEVDDVSGRSNTDRLDDIINFDRYAFEKLSIYKK